MRRNPSGASHGSQNNCNPGAIVVDSQPSGNRKAEVYTTTWTGFYC